MPASVLACIASMEIVLSIAVRAGKNELSRINFPMETARISASAD
jgi:hypothetical protein